MILNDYQKRNILSPFPKNIKIVSTDRYINGGQSSGNLSNFNLAYHVNDRHKNVSANRKLLMSTCNLPADPSWINQTHS